MGQRTQVLVIKEDNKGNRKSSFYHHQWGFGRVMYLALMDLVMTDYNKETWGNGKEYNFFDTMKFNTNPKLRDFTKDVPTEVLEKVDPDNFQTIQDIFAYGDNNNGGMVVYVKQDEKEYGMSKFKVGFLLGSEDTYVKNEKGEWVEGPEEEFGRWLTPEEYGRMNGGSNYSDPKFVKTFRDFMDYFEVETFNNI